MTTGHDPSPNDGALTPEERLLAARLARSAPQRGPPAALDARILDAARAAAQAPSATRPAASRRQRPRWPMITGVAASLTLALGLAWQLRPTVQLEAASEAAAPAAARSPGAGGPSAADDYAPMPAEEVAADAAAPATAAPPLEEAKQAAPMTGQIDGAARREDARAQAVFSPPAEPEPQGQMAADAMPAPAPPSPPPVAAPVVAAPAPSAFGESSAPASGQAAPASNIAGNMSRSRSDADTAAKRAPASTPDLNLDRVIVTGSSLQQDKARAAGAAAEKAEDRNYRDSDGGHDQPLDDEPPASAEAPEVRDAWLNRVRDLLAHGDRDAARDSLREYQRRNPDARIPDDLKPLLSE